jgi:hypothetical protein
MRNRFIDLLIAKQQKLEKKAISESYSLYPENDPTKYNPWEDIPPTGDKKK